MAGIATSARQVPMPRPAPAVRFGVPWGALAPGLRYPLGVVALTAAYYASAKIGYALELAGPVAAIIWLPVGVGISLVVGMAGRLRC